MKQIEVRLAVVLYGGVSLAVYIHGVTREILNLVRASKQFRSTPDKPPPDASKGGDSTAVYFDLLRRLSPHIDLRVVVDLISGASAGGINGVMLGRAIAHDLPLEPHRDLWLKNADVTSLSAPASLLSRAGKAALAPLFDQLLMRRFGRQVADPETRAKLRQFIQAQWFKPPFSGELFAGWMLDACDAMDETTEKALGERNGSLLPPGHRLDLFVTLTDYRGHSHRILLHDPPSVDETEHRRIVCFTCRRALTGELTSDFEPGDVPSLVFSARATASFPGAFPPATIAEMDRILSARNRAWPSRERFVAQLMPADPRAAANSGGYFIDGSVVMNKPFSPVIHALGNRPASREVVRRIIYVDPNPHREASHRGDQGTPGFFRTILTALALIPRNEPIADDLMAIQEWNERARRMQEILAAADPQVERLVDQIVDADLENPPSIADVARYRSAANEKAFAGAGFAYLSYQTLKLRRLIEHLAELTAELATLGGAETGATGIGLLLDRMIAMNEADAAARFVPFLRSFDVDFRLRRIRFVIRRLNELYRTMEDSGGQLQSGALDQLKGALYEVVDRLTRRWDATTLGPEAIGAALRIARAAAEGDTPGADALKPLETAMGLIEIDNDLDEIISIMGLAFLPPLARRAVAMSYVGFAFYDLITFPILQWTDMDEINEVLVDRISPADSEGLGSEKVILKGTALMSFGAFFNRTWREHDYLWGRLNAADRCIDVLMSAIGPRLAEPVDGNRLRADLFNAILESEAPNLTADPNLIPETRRKLGL